MKRSQLISKLRKQTAEYFQSKNYDPPEQHYILRNRDDWQRNIIVPKVARYIQERRKKREGTELPFPLHKWIHHGLSSQACLFNLLGTVVRSKDHSIFKGILSLAEPLVRLRGNIDIAEFEYEDRDIFQEKTGQPTSVDLYISTDRNEKVIIEFKFTESEFGTCSVYEAGDCDGANPAGHFDRCFLHKEKRRNYMKLMDNYQLLPKVEYCPFTEFYQAYRLLLFALENKGRFLLIHDERNPAFLTTQNGELRGKYLRFKNLLPQNLRENVSILSIQKIVSYLEKESPGAHMMEFKKKYYFD